MTLIFTLIGAVVGVVMGITGAGGAIIAIPLFQLLLGSTIKEATILSLVAVIFGTLVNLFGRTEVIKWKIAVGFAIFGTVANYFSIPLKVIVSDSFIAVSLLFIGIFSIWSVWKSQIIMKPHTIKINIFKLASVGLLLGLITTLTGLGGGVILIPLLLKVFDMTYEDALPTSLATIALISSSALLMQGFRAIELITIYEMIFIGSGALIGFVGLKFAFKSMKDENKLRLRKIVFSITTFASLIIVVLKTF